MLDLLEDNIAFKDHFSRDLKYFCSCETNRISAGGNPTLYTSVVVPGGLPRAIPVSAMPKSIQKDNTKQIEYNIYLLH
jgi:hypothetical protein